MWRCVSNDFWCRRLWGVKNTFVGCVCVCRTRPKLLCCVRIDETIVNECRSCAHQGRSTGAETASTHTHARGKSHKHAEHTLAHASTHTHTAEQKMGCARAYASELTDRRAARAAGARPGKAPATSLCEFEWKVNVCSTANSVRLSQLVWYYGSNLLFIYLVFTYYRCKMH